MFRFKKCVSNRNCAAAVVVVEVVVRTTAVKYAKMPARMDACGVVDYLQYSAKRGRLGCVNSHPRPEGARTRAHAT